MGFAKESDHTVVVLVVGEDQDVEGAGFDGVAFFGRVCGEVVGDGEIEVAGFGIVSHRASAGLGFDGFERRVFVGGILMEYVERAVAV